MVLPDDVPVHPYAAAMETVRLAPQARVNLYPWKASQDRMPQVVRQVHDFFRAHHPVSVAHQGRRGGAAQRRHGALRQ